MKKANKTSNLIRSKMVFKFKKNAAAAPCSGGTIDPTTIFTTTTTGRI